MILSGPLLTLFVDRATICSLKIILVSEITFSYGEEAELKVSIIVMQSFQKDHLDFTGILQYWQYQWKWEYWVRLIWYLMFMERNSVYKIIPVRKIFKCKLYQTSLFKWFFFWPYYLHSGSKIVDVVIFLIKRLRWESSTICYTKPECEFFGAIIYKFSY